MNDKIRILYIDDYELDRELVRDALEREHGGFKVTEACNRREFEALLKNQDFDVILSDFNIAGFEGLQVIETVRAHDPRIPVIIVTGTGSEEIAARALKQGASDYVIKRPQHIRKLPQTIFAAIEKKALRDQREKAEAALRESERRYKNILENVLMGVYQVTLDGKFLFANKKLIEIFGCSSYEELEAIESIADLYARPDERNRVVDKIISKGSMTAEVEFRRKDGQKIWVRLHARKTMTEQGEIILEGLMEDITEVRNMAVQLQRAQKMEAIGTLASGIAHDFNNILGAILGYAELGRMELPPDSEVIEDLDEVIRAGNRAKRLVQQILTVSREHPQEQQPLQIRYIVREALKLLRSTLPTTIEIKEPLSRECGVVRADPTQIHQVIMNLCTNAGHAMERDGGVLTVELADVELDDIATVMHMDMEPGSYLRLTISDTGHGMKPRIMARIFDPYFTTKDVGEGTGLGLSVAQGIVNAHGGAITVYSEPGVGSTFHVYLPVISEEGTEKKEAEQETFPTGSERILFVDDEEVLVKVGRQMLQRLGYEVVTQTGSAEALALFRENPDRFDLVITDTTMPHMPGDVLAQELMKIRPDIPVIICTGHSKRISQDKANALGIKGLMMKPLTLHELARTVKDTLDSAGEPS